MNERKLLFCNWPFWSLFKRNRGSPKTSSSLFCSTFTLQVTAYNMSFFPQGQGQGVADVCRDYCNTFLRRQPSLSHPLQHISNYGKTAGLSYSRFFLKTMHFFFYNHAGLIGSSILSIYSSHLFLKGFFPNHRKKAQLQHKSKAFTCK